MGSDNGRMRGVSESSPAGLETASRMGRRAFLQKGSVGLAGAGLTALFAGPRASAETSEKSRLVMVKHARATDDQGAGQTDIVRPMVDRSIQELTGKDSLADAWREFVSPDDVVGLKINVRGGSYLSTQPCVVDAIVAGLVAAGVRENNIIVWDALTWELPRAGFTLNSSDQGVRCYATDKGRYTPGKGRRRGDTRAALRPFYSDEPVQVADQAVYFSKILTDEITALINVPMIKDHRIAGVTCSMKNHYGSILNPSDLHRSFCDPYIAALNAAAPIRDKTRLIVVDGLRALYNGGPRDAPPWRWRQNCIIAGTDPVAVDTLALRIIEEKRKEKGMRPIGERAKHVATAAEKGLGTNDPAQMDLREIDNTADA